MLSQIYQFVFDVQTPVATCIIEIFLNDANFFGKFFCVFTCQAWQKAAEKLFLLFSGGFLPFLQWTGKKVRGRTLFFVFLLLDQWERNACEDRISVESSCPRLRATLAGEQRSNFSDSFVACSVGSLLRLSPISIETLRICRQPQVALLSR